VPTTAFTAITPAKMIALDKNHHAFIEIKVARSKRWWFFATLPVKSTNALLTDTGAIAEMCRHAR
jgi:hypothetical protein